MEPEAISVPDTAKGPVEDSSIEVPPPQPEQAEDGIRDSS